MIRKKRLNVEDLNSLGKAIVRIAGKRGLSENRLTNLQELRFMNQFGYAFFGYDPWFYKRYVEVLDEKITLEALLNRMRKRFLRSGKARSLREADSLIEKKMAFFLAKSERLKKRLWAQRAKNPAKENQIADHQVRNNLVGLTAVCDELQYLAHKSKKS